MWARRIAQLLTLLFKQRLYVMVHNIKGINSPIAVEVLGITIEGKAMCRIASTLERHRLTDQWAAEGFEVEPINLRAMDG